MSDLTCILRRKGSILLSRSEETVICGQAIVEGYLRKGFVFDWAATDEARAKDPAASATPSQRLDAATVERCAQVADDHADQTEDTSVGRARNQTARAIADELRALATEPHQHGGKGA